MTICCLYRQDSVVCICTVLLYVEERLLFCKLDLKYVGISWDKCSENGKFIYIWYVHIPYIVYPFCPICVHLHVSMGIQEQKAKVQKHCDRDHAAKSP